MFGSRTRRVLVVLATMSSTLTLSAVAPVVVATASDIDRAEVEILDDRGRVPAPVAAVPASTAVIDLAAPSTQRSAADGQVVTVASGDAGSARRAATTERSRVQLDVLGEETATELGGAKVAFQLSAVDVAAAGAPAALSIDYSTFATAFGGEWANRLRLVEFPACALTTPSVESCITPVSVESVNDWVNTTLTANVNITGGTQPVTPEPTTASSATSTPITADAPTTSVVESPSTSSTPTPATASSSTTSSSTTTAATTSAPGAVAPTASAIEEVESPVFVLMAATNSDAGDFSASPLSSAASWNVGLGTGSFNWSYPLPTVPSPHGATPNLSLAYSSQAADGMTVSTNNQPGVAGQNWEITGAGFVERRFKPCARVGGAVADNCWVDDNAVISFGGQSEELVKLPTSSLPGATEWRMENDENWRIYSFVGSGNDDFQGERWEVTTPDGTKATFGLQHIGGFDHQSVLTTPVIALSSGQPCWDQPNHMCDLAWRWMLDSVTDTNGNTQSYFWQKEWNWYGARGRPADPRRYDMAARLVRVEYGEDNDSNLYSTEDVGLTFSYEYRCIGLNGCSEAPSSANGDQFPDVPNDLICGPTEFCDNFSPSFFSGYRLKQVTSWSRVNDVYTYADRIVISHDWTCEPEDPNSGGDVGVCAGTLNGLATKLWMRGIQRYGSPIGDSPDTVIEGEPLPPIRFDSVTTNNTGWNGRPVGEDWAGTDNATLAFPNRADAFNGRNSPYPQFLYRITQVRDELGSVLQVTYAQPSGCIGKTGPIGPWYYVDNSSNCFPQWTDTSTPGDNGEGSASGWGLFNKYIVVLTRQKDMTPGAEDIVTRYDYSNATTENAGSTAMWRYQDSRWATYRTYNDWRGYNQVQIRTGDGVPMTRHLLYRGMNGDQVPAGFPGAVDGKRTATVDNQADELWLSGIERHTRTMLAADAADFDGGTELTLEVRLPTVSVTADTGTFTARRVRIAQVESYTEPDLGLDHKTDVTTTYNSDGYPTKIRELGTDGSSSVLRCTYNHYAPNTGPEWILDRPTYTELFEGECSDTPFSALTQTYFYYDNRNTDAEWSTPPTQGNLTEQRVWIDGGSYAITTTTHDSHGRVLTATDPNGNTTTTAYNTPVGPYTQTTVTNVLNQQTITTLDPRWLVPLTTIDPNGNTTTQTYDKLGRLSKVWLADNATAPSGTPSYEYGYELAVPPMPNPFVPPGVPAHRVSSAALHDLAHTAPVSVAYIDTFGRTRQTQSPSPSPGSVIVSGATTYDFRGLATTTYANFPAAGAPAGGMQTAPTDALRTVTAYDGARRPTTTTQSVAGQADLVTTTDYNIWTTEVNPPGGKSAPTTTRVDSFGRTVELIEHNPDGVDASTTYTYTAADWQLTATDPGINVTQSTYDHAGRRSQLVEPSSGTTTTGYDPAGNVVLTTTGVGTPSQRTVAYSYDALHRRTDTWANAADVGTPLAEWSYDTTPGGIGQLASSVRHDGSGDYTVAVGGYTARLLPTDQTWTMPSSQGALSASYTYSYTYNLAGDRTSTHHPQVANLPEETVTTAFDDLGSPDSLTSNVPGGPSDTSGGAFVTDTIYDNLGRISSRLLGGTGAGIVTRSYGYDDYQRLDQLTTATTGGNVRDDVYTYNPETNIGSITDTVIGQAECFDYDTRNRLQGAVTSTVGCAAPNAGGVDPYNETYAFDPLGRMSGRDTGAYTYDPARPYQLLSGNGVTYSYNGDGTAASRATAATGTQTFGWDQEGRLGSTSTASCAPYTSCISTNTYDADGNRIVRRTPQADTAYVGPDEITRQNIAVQQLGQWNRRPLLPLLLPIDGRITTGTVNAPANQLLVATVTYRHYLITAPGGAITLTDSTGTTWTKQAETFTPDNLLDPSLRVAIFTRTTTTDLPNLTLTASANTGLLNLYYGWNVQLAAYTNATVAGSGTNTGATPPFAGGPASVTVTGPVPPGSIVHAGISQAHATTSPAGGTITPADPTSIELAEAGTRNPNEQTQYGTTATSNWTLTNPGRWAAAAITLTPTVSATRSYAIGMAVGVRTEHGYAITTGDHHGTGTTTIDANGTATTRRITPYGVGRESSPTSWPNDHTYLNQPSDKTGLNYLTSRYYDPAAGAFISVDPLVSSTAQPYLYGGGNPISFSDPSGLEPCGLAGNCTEEYATQERITDNKRGGCARRLDCGEHEIRYLTAKQRRDTLWLFSELFGFYDSQGRDWFDAIEAVTDVWDSEGAFSYGWISTTNASIVHGILDGARVEYSGGTYSSPNESATLWAGFFQLEGEGAHDYGTMLKAWSAAETAATNRGVQMAEALGLPKPAWADNFLDLSQIYRDNMSRAGTAAQLPPGGSRADRLLEGIIASSPLDPRNYQLVYQFTGVAIGAAKSNMTPDSFSESYLCVVAPCF